MLTQITLHHFRQFEHKVVNFEPGNTSLRGANEGGKTTVIEGFLYLLSGAKACRNNDFVKWNSKATQCKVEARMTLQGTQIRAVRGKSGAEIYVPHDNPQPTVTGQTECTNWFAEQMGASLDVSKKMCFAEQKQIGGLLDDPAGKSVEFIESMSGLDIVETLIGRIQATGKVGVTTALVERANADRAQLESQAGISYDEAIARNEAEIGPLEAAKADLDIEIAGFDLQVKADRAKLQKVTVYAANLANAQTALQRAQNQDSSAALRLDEAKTALQAARAESAIDADLEAAQERQRNSDDTATRRKLKAAADAWPAPEAEWDEGAEALQKFVAENREVAKAAAKLCATLHQRIAVAESKKVSASACGLCGKDVSEFPDVKAKNVQLDAEIAVAKAEHAEQFEIGSEAEGNVAAGDAILKSQSFHAALTRPDLFEVDHKYVPFRFKWIGGDIPAAGTDETKVVAALKAERQQRAALEKDLASAVTSAKAASAAVLSAGGSLDSLLAAAPSETEESLTAKIATREQELNERRLKAFKLAEDLGAKRSLLSSLQQSKVSHAANVARLSAALERTESELALVEFHNTLIDDLRKARPVVANKLWSVILLSVSTYLTKMRGEPSIVEREGKNFKVNGRPSSSYSGSALDLLALGIRIALAKIFVPGADMLVLDEPFAACDAERTLQCLAFSSAAGFNQTIVITHESGTEGVFSNIVEV